MNNINTHHNRKRNKTGEHPNIGPLASVMEQTSNSQNDDGHSYFFLPEQSAFSNIKNVTPKDAELLIAKQMNSLTVNERQKAYEDLHAVPQVIKETPESVAKSIEQFQKELDKIKVKDAYEKALKQGPKYVDTKRFKLMFLRSTSFNAREAANRMVRHFKEKLCWFGEDALGRPIVFSDMDVEEIKLINSGFIQFLSSRDTAGRRIVWTNLLGGTSINVKSMARAIWYVCMTMFEVDEESQIRGNTIIFYISQKFEMNQFARNYSYATSRLIPTTPQRVGGLHFCLTDSKLAYLVSLFNFVAGSRINCRCRVHQGSETELQYKLMTFGINYEVLPIKSTGEVSLKSRNEWVLRQRIREQMFPYLLYDRQGEIGGVPDVASSIGDRLAIIDLPGRYDIMLGRGKPCQTHSGNEHLYEMVESRRGEIDKAPRGGKKMIYKKILDKIHSLGGRFVELQSEGWWTEVSNDVALDKVGHAYRNLSPKRSGQQQAQRRSC